MTARSALPVWLEKLHRHSALDITDRFQRFDRTLDADDEFVLVRDLVQACPTELPNNVTPCTCYAHATSVRDCPAHRKDPQEDGTILALKNMGIDVECGACMEIAFTGVTTNMHSCLAALHTAVPAQEVPRGNQHAAFDAAVQACPPAEEDWQPIETAPKDDWILGGVFHKAHGWLWSRAKYHKYPALKEEEWIMENGMTPTHWLPAATLPPAVPAQEKR